MDNQWMFIDESGKPEVYSSKGTNLVETKQASKYLVLSAIRSNNQLLLQQQVIKFRLKLLKDKKLNKIFSSSYSLDSFHAQTDYKDVQYQCAKNQSGQNVRHNGGSAY